MEPYVKSLRSPDETLRLPGLVEEMVDLGDLTVGRAVTQPGWRWSKDLRPLVGGQWCQARHVGVLLSGRLGFLMANGVELSVGPDDVYDIPPGHDGYALGDEPVVALEWSGLRALAGSHRGPRYRELVTLLLTDIVQSTPLAARLGDHAWGERLSAHYESARAQFDRFGGQEVATTGDGVLATFPSPAGALACAAEIRRLSQPAGLHVRAGVHVGEVERLGTAVRGLAVHQVARIMAAAGPDEVLVSDVTRTLALPAGLGFADRGRHRLKGLDGEWQLFAFVEDL